MLTIDPDTTTGVITILTAIGVLITTIVNAIITLRTKARGAANAGAIQEVHTLVNSYATVQAARIEQLTAANTAVTGQSAPNSPSMPAEAPSPDIRPNLEG